jgi:hypothetical protein
MCQEQLAAPLGDGSVTCAAGGDSRQNQKFVAGTELLAALGDPGQFDERQHRSIVIVHVCARKSP